jgi:hypothetical protein
MKLEQLKKTYSQLSQHELAVLAFEAMVRKDEKEISAIINSMPKRHCTLNIGVDYHLHLKSMFDLSDTYGVMYWKSVACAFLKGVNDEIHIDSISAMNAALVIVCDKMNINVESVRTIALCDGMPLEDEDESVDQEILKLFVDMFMRFLV